MPEKLTLEDVRGRCTLQGFELLTEEYRSSVQVLECRCMLCHKAIITRVTTMLGRKGKYGCTTCFLRDHHPRKMSYEKVVQRFAEKGFELLTKEYHNSTQELEYRCRRCERVDHVSIAHLSQGTGKYGCRECAKQHLRDENMRMYGVEYACQTELVKQRMRETCLARFGTPYPLMAEEIKAKARATWMANYGVINPSYCPEILQKIIDTFKERYGGHPMHVPEFRDKQCATFMAKYGVKNPMQNKEVRARWCATLLARYGYDNPMKVPEFYRKAQLHFKRHAYHYPSGKMIKVQGYESAALDLLLTVGYTEEDIAAGDDSQIPVIHYEMNGKMRTFYPDIYLPREKKIIEVKSTYTYLLAPEKNITKQRACLEQGYDCEFWVLDRKHEIVDLITRDHRLIVETAIDVDIDAVSDAPTAAKSDCYETDNSEINSSDAENQAEDFIEDLIDDAEVQPFEIDVPNDDILST